MQEQALKSANKAVADDKACNTVTDVSLQLSTAPNK